MAREIKADTLLSVVAPIYNEVENIEPFVKEVWDSLEQIRFPGKREIVLVNDGSADGSAEKLDAMAAQHPEEIRVVHLARNFGHSAAVCAALDHAKGDAVILMDSDRQDDPAAFGPFVEKWKEGYDVIYALRASREESWLSRLLFWLFYRLLRAMAHIEIPANAGNFCLMDRQALALLTSLRERNRYLPGLRAWVGFRQTGVPVPRRARYDKETRVGFQGLWRLAMDAVFSFSYVPLFFCRVIGVVTIGLAALLVGFAAYHKLFTGLAIPAWTSEITAICFFGGINMLGIGLVGEYVARIYDEVRGRPIYVVARTSGGK